MGFTIKTNFGHEIKIDKPNLIVKDDKLYNTDTKKFEGLDGDRICVNRTLENGQKMSSTGTVEGYTYNGAIKLRGVKEAYQSDSYAIEHVVKIKDFIDDNAVKTEIVYAD